MPRLTKPLRRLFAAAALALWLAVLILPSAALAAGTKRIGSECATTKDSECVSESCEKSDIVVMDGSQQQKNKYFCTCGQWYSWNANKECFIEYKAPEKGGEWKCASPADNSHNLHYCYSSNGEVRFPVRPDSNLDATDALTDLPAFQATLLSEIQSGAFKPKPAIRIPGLSFADISQPDEEGYLHIPWIGQYIAAIYKFGIAVSSIVAVAIIMKKAIDIVISGGAETAEHYKRIGQIVIGVMLMWGSYVIMFYINPDLVSFKALRVKYVETIKLEQYNEQVNLPGSEGVSGETTFGANNIPDYKQCDTRWKDTPYDGVYKGAALGCFKTDAQGKPAGTICTSGCGVTSLADVLTFHGYPTSPPEAAAFAVEVGARTGCFGTRAPLVCKSISSRWPALSCSLINAKKETDKIVSLLRQIKPIIFSCHGCTGSKQDGSPITYKAHFMVLTGVDGTGKFFSVNDPGRRKGNDMVKISIDEFLQDRVASTLIIERK